MYYRLILITLTCFMTSCNGTLKEKENIMTIDKFDIDSFNSSMEKDSNTGNLIYLEDGTKIIQSVSAKNGDAFEKIIHPSPIFYITHKSYNGTNYNLESVKKTIGGMLIGKTQFFNIQAELVKEINEELKFGKHDYNDCLEFLEKEGWIKIKTGEGRDRFSLVYENDIWYITIEADAWNGYMETYFEVDANTKEVLKKEETQLGIE